MSWTIDATLAAKIAFATHQNAIAVIRDLSVSAPTDVGAQNLRLKLSADPPFVQTKTWRIDAMQPGDALRIADRDVALNATLLRDLTEGLTGTLDLTKPRSRRRCWCSGSRASTASNAPVGSSATAS